MLSMFILLFSTSIFFFFKQKTAYEMRTSDWSSDVCSSDMAASATPPIDDATLAASGRRVLDTEARGLDAVGARPNGDFSRPCRLLLACRGRVVCIVMGQSGHVARKVAANSASTVPPAFYVPPGATGRPSVRDDCG